ncbi:hypothetical protein OS493_008479 [Desmophyllum pertusum]|uniref:L-serine deaminase n=1 Tax=Desmophyllum pertusum TaxID=174260 RepID=A0A9W9ZR05_9CNID|nr:hypothetical protein OS493_008479 [Desmophyllum pertusum]
MLAGLGTLGLEILDQCECKLEAVVVPNSDKTLLKALRHSIKSIFPHIKIMGAQVKNKELTRVRSFPDIDVSDTSDGVIQVSDADLSRTVIRVLEEKGVLLSKEGVSGLAAVMAGDLTQLTNTRVVVVLSECLVPSLLQLEQLINEGLAARDW